MGDDFTMGMGTVGWGAWFSWDSGGSGRQVQKRMSGPVRSVRMAST
ncbi:MAG: hypothetical protein GY929_11765 [Actinomycetia bacterium]|nr:hypothetical protein [Actinomycetes bacterium]